MCWCRPQVSHEETCEIVAPLVPEQETTLVRDKELIVTVHTNGKLCSYIVEEVSL